MTVVRAQLAFGQSLGPGSFGDLTDAEVTVGWGPGGLFEVTLTPDVPAEVVTAVRCRVISQTSVDEQLRRDIADSLSAEPSPDRTAALVEAVARLALEVP